MVKQQLSEIENFLDCSRIAIIGISRDPKSISRSLMRTLVDSGYDVVPVNPAVSDIENIKCYGKVQDIVSQVEFALIMLNKDALMESLQDCVSAGIKNVWIYGVSGPREIDEKILEYCDNEELNLVAGYCPFMFLKNTAWLHRLHGSIWKMVGLYPK
ncbi:MAG: CoA-binding protein [Candidatus Electryonea clarkiae]|nr:CoA-binding protein [Candidatus Electryonea clarkiae]MDP8286816.1 CoA-binding protein [Candidatus Electryonea clarkiae]